MSRLSQWRRLRINKLSIPSTTVLEEVGAGDGSEGEDSETRLQRHRTTHQGEVDYEIFSTGYGAIAFLVPTLSRRTRRVRLSDRRIHFTATASVCATKFRTVAGTRCAHRTLP